MELTNLVWHLGALVAAVWAAFAYRSLVFSRAEMEQAVLATVLLPTGAEAPQSSHVLSQGALLARRRSLRARALHWFASELRRRKGIDLRWPRSIFETSDEIWRAALADLYVYLNPPVQLVPPSSPVRVLTWVDEDGKPVGWSVESTTGVSI